MPSQAFSPSTSVLLHCLATAIYSVRQRYFPALSWRQQKFNRNLLHTEEIILVTEVILSYGLFPSPN